MVQSKTMMREASKVIAKSAEASGDDGAGAILSAYVSLMQADHWLRLVGDSFGASASNGKGPALAEIRASISQCVESLRDYAQVSQVGMFGD